MSSRAPIRAPRGTALSCRGWPQEAAARTHYGKDDLAGKLVLSAGLGGMGGAQPLAVTMAGGVFLGVEVDPQRMQRRLEHRYLDEAAGSLDEALRKADEYKRKGTARS